MRKGKRRREEERGGGGKVGGAHRDFDHTYPEFSVARATLVFFFLFKQVYFIYHSKMQLSI